MFTRQKLSFYRYYIHRSKNVSRYSSLDYRFIHGYSRQIYRNSILQAIAIAKQLIISR